MRSSPEIGLNLCRQNEGLEQDALAMQVKQARLQQEAKILSERLHAVLKDRCVRKSGFDAETPIDKTLNYLQGVITVSHHCVTFCMQCGDPRRVDVNNGLEADICAAVLGCCQMTLLNLFCTNCKLHLSCKRYNISLPTILYCR